MVVYSRYLPKTYIAFASCACIVIITKHSTAQHSPINVEMSDLRAVFVLCCATPGIPTAPNSELRGGGQKGRGGTLLVARSCRRLCSYLMYSVRWTGLLHGNLTRHVPSGHTHCPRCHTGALFAISTTKEPIGSRTMSAGRNCEKSNPAGFVVRRKRRRERRERKAKSAASSMISPVLCLCRNQKSIRIPSY